MNIVIAFFVGSVCGAAVMAFMNGCTNNKLIEEAYTEGFMAGRNVKKD